MEKKKENNRKGNQAWQEDNENIHELGEART